MQLKFSVSGLLALVAVVSAGAAPTTGPVAKDPFSPDAELALMKVLDGYEVKLFASEADGISKPIQMRFDERGRLWVTCSTTYPQIAPGKKPDDKIVILEDTDGDGKADKSTVFADGLLMPTGLELGAGGVYVAGATELLFLRDTNGDDKADQREVLYSGFGTGDAHQMINSFLWGPEGALWFGQGLHTFSTVETPWGVEQLYSAGVWRMRPRTQRLDPFLGSDSPTGPGKASGPANPWGYAFDEWGQVFCNDGAGNTGLTWLVPAMIRSSRDVPLPTMWRIPKGCGIDFVRTTAMPDDLQGRLIMGHYFTASVRQFQITDDGAGFAATEMPALIRSDTNAFRPTDAKFGPDGSLYICDWYNPVIGHYQASYRDPNRDKTHGRIWRLTAKGRPLTKPPNLAAMSPLQLLDQLRSPDRWTTYQARRLLFNGSSVATTSSPGVVAAADAWVAGLDPKDAQYEHNLYAAIGIFESHEAVRPELLQKLIAAKDFRARAYAARVVGHWADRLDHPLDLLRTLIQDEQPRVRAEALVSTSYVSDPHAIEVAAMAADRPIDQWINHAMLRAVDALKDQWRPAFSRGQLKFDGKVNRLSWVLNADGTAEVAGPVRAMLSAPGVDAKDRSELAVLLANIGTSDDLRALLDGFSSNAAVLHELGDAWRVRKVRPAGDLEKPVLSLLDASDPAVRIEAMRLAGAWSMNGAADRIKQLATDAAQPPDARVAAITSLGEMRVSSTAGMLTRLTNTQQPQAIRVAAVTALAISSPQPAAKAAASVLQDLQTPDQIGSVLGAFAQRKGGPTMLAKAIKESKLPPQAAQRCLDVLYARGRDDAALVDAFNALLGITPTTPPYSEKYIDDLAAEVRQVGDAQRGRTLYETKLVACAACHSIDGKGGNLGPDLSAVGRGLTTEYIAESVLWPRRQVKEGYLSVSISTKDGDEFSGYIVAENATEIQLRDIATGTVQRIPKATVSKRIDAGTIMPEGLTAALSRQELCDLIGYLSHLGK